MLKEQLITELMYFMVEFEGKVARPAQLCAKNTVSGVQLQLLLFLQHYGPQSMSQLAEHKKISKPQLSAAVNGLVTLGLVARKPDDTDRRIIRIQCTEEGTAYLNNLNEQLINYLSQSVDTLTAEEQQRLLTSLHTAGQLIHKFNTSSECLPPEFKKYT